MTFELHSEKVVGLPFIPIACPPNSGYGRYPWVFRWHGGFHHQCVIGVQGVEKVNELQVVLVVHASQAQELPHGKPGVFLGYAANLGSVFGLDG